MALEVILCPFQGGSEMLQCPRCQASVPAHPGVCGTCGENVYQCHKCRYSCVCVCGCHAGCHTGGGGGGKGGIPPPPQPKSPPLDIRPELN